MCDSFEEWWEKGSSPVVDCDNHELPYYVAKAAYAAGLERAAVIAESMTTFGKPIEESYKYDHPWEIAAAIREEIK